VAAAALRRRDPAGAGEHSVAALSAPPRATRRARSRGSARAARISMKETTMRSYLRFAAMIATSTLVMFGLMYLNTYQLDHVTFSETRAYMALVMGAAMALVMLTFMRSMYERRGPNLVIYVGSAVVFGASLWLVRSQATVDDVAYMRAMIPHHSIALLTSERARIEDPRVRALADQIIEAQRTEIERMKELIDELEGR
jgi:hypothetical protein